MHADDACITKWIKVSAAAGCRSIPGAVCRPKSFGFAQLRWNGPPGADADVLNFGNIDVGRSESIFKIPYISVI